MAKKQRNRTHPHDASPPESSSSKPSSPNSEKSDSENRSSENLTPAQVRAAKFRVAAMRENVEAIVVAFILALLFRAFLAEAFVIPTGSMAPTLMGAHKDLFCDQCGQNFRVGASRERRGPNLSIAVVGGVCPNCRHVNSLDLVNNSEHATFNGDRILVNKFSYVLSEPERWDVIVFKFPGNPKQNYIKRLVGLPNETITIEGGDVYAKTTGTDNQPAILRKPPSTLMAMSHLVCDSDKQSSTLIKANYPCRWQPWRSGSKDVPTDSWQIQRTASGLSASLSATENEQWLRYFHHFPTSSQWEKAIAGESLADVNAYRSRAITDFYAYGSYISVPASYVYSEPPTQKPVSRRRFGKIRRMFRGGYSAGTFRESYESGGSIDQFRRAIWGSRESVPGEQGLDGMHWAGDLLFTSDVDFGPACKTCTLEIVESGVRYQCQIDLSTGVATLSIKDEERVYVFDTENAADSPHSNPTATTPVRAGGAYSIRLSNCDDQLVLWVEGKVIEFDAPTTYNARWIRPADVNRPYFGQDHPLDASPVGIAVSGGKAEINRLQIFRDKYYISTKHGSQLLDYDFRKIVQNTGRGISERTIQEVLANPTKWEGFPGWQARRRTSYEMKADQFFPMGDNSPESLDARCWAGTKPRIPMPRGVNKDAWIYDDAWYVPRDLLVGRAVVVFWPHSWNSPLPMTPNIKRVKLIR